MQNFVIGFVIGFAACLALCIGWYHGKLKPAFQAEVDKLRGVAASEAASAAAKVNTALGR